MQKNGFLMRGGDLALRVEVSLSAGATRVLGTYGRYATPVVRDPKGTLIIQV